MGTGTGSESGRVVLGLSFDFHDAAAALVVDGDVVAAVEEERFSRIKHDPGLPVESIASCLEIAGLSAGDIDHVVFYEKPLAVAARFLAAKQSEGPRALRSFLRDAPKVFGTNLIVGYRVAKVLRDLGARRPPQLQFVEHHLSHAASAFLPSPFEHAAVLTVDGIGEWATATIGHGSRRRLSLLEELRYPDSLGLVYSFATAYCGFRPNDDEYKLMGLAPYGTPRFVDELSSLVDRRPDGSVQVHVRQLSHFAGRGLDDPALARAFDGPRRRADDELTQREADLAASVQLMTEEAVIRMARRARELTEEPRLCMAGGVALNCVANGKLARGQIFDEIWVQPAAGDAGGALGAALAYWHLELGRPRDADGRLDKMSGSFLGPDVDGDAARTTLDDLGIPYSLPATEDELFRTVAERLDGGAIVGWYRGRMEFGPRALGHRSLLADPRSTDARQRLNAITKGRESFRPFAPAVLADRAAEWFEIDQPSPYMLMVAPVRAEHLLEVVDEPTDLGERARIPRSTIPACTHVDGSARIQTVAADTNADLHRLITAFADRTGCPLLVNTSFNRAGEPIVATVEGAVASGRAAQVDLLVVGNALVEGADLTGRPPDPVPTAVPPVTVEAGVS